MTYMIQVFCKRTECQIFEGRKSYNTQVCVHIKTTTLQINNTLKINQASMHFRHLHYGLREDSKEMLNQDQKNKAE